jgi:hypothetical protein
VSGRRPGRGGLVAYRVPLRQAVCLSAQLAGSRYDDESRSRVG